MTPRSCFAPSIVLAGFIVLAGCGSGSTTGGDVPPDGGDASTTSLATPAGCPAAMPADGEPCSPAALQCEYGNFAWSDCNAMATCTTKGWSVAPPPAAICASNNTMCPSSVAEIQRGAACSSAGITCFFAEATCACSNKVGTGGEPVWACDDPPAGCPVQRPHLGEPCSDATLVCDYSSCGAAVHNIKQQCKDGYWRYAFTSCD